MTESLTPGARARARRNFDYFNVFNASSFVILSGSLVTLFALRLGASASLVGLINALTYVSFFFMPLGKRLAARRPIVSVYILGWVLRYLAMIPLVLAPLPLLAGSRGGAFALLLAGVAGFNVARGVGMIGNNPVLASLAEGGDRGAFISRVNLVANLSALATNLAVSLVLGREPGLLVYAALVGSGIGLGLAGTLWLRRIPEPTAYRPAQGGGIWRTVREALREPPYRRFMAVFLIVNFAAGMGRPFLPVYAKTRFGQGDDFVMILTFVGSLAGVAVGLLSRLVIDRLGAKPLYAIYAFTAILGLAPAMVSPELAAGLGPALLLAAVFFVSSFGLSGQDNAGQAYYFALVPRERTFDLAVAYFVANGIAGTLGSLAGGLALDGFALAGFGPAASWRLFFGLVGLLLLLGIARMGGLVRLGSASFRQSLEALVSLRDLRAFDILTRLDRAEGPREELALIRELGLSRSPRSQRDLVGFLSSPRFELRVEALLSLEQLPGLDAETVAALRAEVSRGADTTGYIAARILGKLGDSDSVPALREALGRPDVFLRGSAAIALARLGDRGSLEAIQGMLRSDLPPRGRIQAAYALEIFGDRSSIPFLVASLSRHDPPAHVSDELVLSMAGLLGIMDDFYGLYQAFCEDRERGLSLLRLSAAERIAAANELARFEGALAALFSEPCDPAPLARDIASAGVDPAAALVFSEALLDPGLGYRGFRYLAAAWRVFGRPRE